MKLHEETFMPWILAEDGRRVVGQHNCRAGLGWGRGKLFSHRITAMGDHSWGVHVYDSTTVTQKKAY